MMWDVVEDCPEVNDQMIPIEYILDTSAGEILTVNDIPRPAGAEHVVDFVPFYEQMNDDYNARLQTLSAERPALEAAYYNRTLPTLQKVRLDSLLVAVSFAQDQPQARALWDESQVLWNELRTIETTRHLLVPYGWAVNTGNYWTLCEGDQEESDEEADPLGMPAPGQCSDGVKATKVGLDLRVVSFSITCEIAEVEVSTGGPLGPFLQVTHDLRKNEITAFFGAKATVMIGPVLELGAKEGFYVRANQDGLTDAGMKVATGGAAHLGGSGISGQIDGPEFEAGVAAAVEYWTDP